MAKYKNLEDSSKRFIERYPFPALSAPNLAPLKKTLSECRLALVTTAGLHLEKDKPFSSSFMASDCSYRKLPCDLDLNRVKISHTSKDFNRDGAEKDINVVFPIERIHELVKTDKLGSSARLHFSFMGSLPRTGTLRKKTAPEVSHLLKEDSVDLVLLTPV